MRIDVFLNLEFVNGSKPNVPLEIPNDAQKAVAHDLEREIFPWHFTSDILISELCPTSFVLTIFRQRHFVLQESTQKGSTKVSSWYFYRYFCNNALQPNLKKMTHLLYLNLHNFKYLWTDVKSTHLTPLPA